MEVKLKEPEYTDDDDVDLLFHAIRLNARRDDFGFSGNVEFAECWITQYSDYARIELLDSWVKVLTAHLNMEKSLAREERGNK
jgi:hypothetical protein